jgi:hypothetical protein
MSRKTRENKTGHYRHDLEKIERSIPNLDYYYYQCKVCGKVEFPIPEFQKLWDYSKKHQFMFLQDWVLALMYAQEMPVIGITSFMKQLFLTLMDFAQENNIPTENPGFKGYKYGPYSERIEDVIISLIDSELIRTQGRKGSNGEYFILTEDGIKAAEFSFNKLTNEQKEQLKEARLDWHQLGTDGLIKYVYIKYPEYTNESLILERYVPTRRLGKKVKLVENDNS